MDRRFFVVDPELTPNRAASSVSVRMVLAVCESTLGTPRAFDKDHQSDVSFVEPSLSNYKD